MWQNGETQLKAIKITYINKKDLVTCSKYFIFQHHSTATSQVLSLRLKCKGDGWLDAIYPPSQAKMFPSLRYRQVQSWIMCLAFLKPQPPLMSVHSLLILAVTCPPDGKLSHPLFLGPSHMSEQRETPQPHPSVTSAFLGGFLPNTSSTTASQQDVLCGPQQCGDLHLCQWCPLWALVLVTASTGAPLSCSGQ